MLRTTLKSLMARKLRLTMSALAVVLGVAFVVGAWPTCTTANVSVHGRARPRRCQSSTTARKPSSRTVKYPAPRSTRRPCTSGDAIRPPGARPRSTSRTAWPARCNSATQAAPAMPAPTTVTACW